MIHLLTKLKLEQKLQALIVLSFFVRVVCFFLLPNNASPLAPDEGTYAALVKWIGESRPVNQFPLYGEGLYVSSKSLVIPSSLLFRAGFGELDAVRIVSSLYGLGSQILVIILILNIYNKKSMTLHIDKFNERLSFSLALVFTFLPSHFFWSVLGLRESASEFWLIFSFLIFFIIFFHRNRITFPTILALFLSIVLTFSARPQVGWVLTITLILYLFLNLKNSLTFILIPLVICATLFGATLNSVSLGTANSNSVNLSTTLMGKGGIFEPLLNSGELVTYKQKVNQLGAASRIATQSCPREAPAVARVPATKFDTYFCIAWRAPYMVSTFLIRPFIGVDVTSTSNLLAAIENIFWFGLLVTIIVLVIRRRATSSLRSILPAPIFFALYVLGASAYQGNMGTGFRHKSLILWVLLLLISALMCRKPEDTYTKPRNNSQESAV